MNMFLRPFLHLMAILSLRYGYVVVNGQVYVLSSSCGSEVNERSKCVLTCQTSSASETSIFWKRGPSVTYDVEYTTCTAPTATSTIPPEYVFDCTGTNYTLTINSTSVTRDGTAWVCDAAFGGKESNTIILDVQAITTTGPPTTEPTSMEFTTTQNNSTAPPSDECDFPFIAVIILAILLVVKIATDIAFIVYRWGGCLTGIGTRKVYILYWCCFIEGIIDCVLGVIFFIVTLAAYTECLTEAFATGTLVLSIFVTIIGIVNILLCCCCYKSPGEDGKTGEVEGKPDSSGPSRNTGGPRPWLCCCCPQTKICSGEESPPAPKPAAMASPRKPAPQNSTSARSLPKPTSDHTRDSTPAPMLAAMASPRKPVPSNTTSARSLPSPTSDLASDSAVNPKIVLDPLNVEDQKKKKKKNRRKKRKSTKEAGEESPAQTMNATEDSDDN